ncbi:MAG: peptidase C45 [Bacteroidetes bacterium]|nr:peptidase C45 [Bacteroidota bacterium]MBL6943311.1 peptidase C45 [Bacteroidales bacterium]
MGKHNIPRRGRRLRRLRNTAIVIVLILTTLIVFFNIKTKISPPEVTDLTILQIVRENPAPDFYKIGSSWLRKNKFGLWEMYLEGSPFEIGVINGKLTKELIKIQEDAFVEQINTLIPSKLYLKFLKYTIAWFNRDIDEYIPDEYLKEIYGVSFSASDGYDYIGNNYERMLNYHGAHDIGHALQNLALVGCTSFATNLNTDDSTLIIGRNFDFYINEAFAENKIVAFVNPDLGHRFMYVTWASMIGVVSGMNEQGLTVTINATKSDFSSKATMPVSLLAREILQYAGNIEEAVSIAEKRQTFVSESIMVGSVADNNTIIIEKSPSKLGVHQTDSSYLTCSNHFQSEVFRNDSDNLKNIEESASKYRQQRCEQLIHEKQKLNYTDVADILRNYKGLNDVNIGIGNEKTMAQMISHHSIIFLPQKLNTWVSTTPYQLGEYLMYNLNDVWSKTNFTCSNTILYDTSLTIQPSPFLYSIGYNKFNEFKKLRKELKKHISYKTRLINEDEFIAKFINCNIEYYQGYVLAADYYYIQNEKQKALSFYKDALIKEFENTSTKGLVEERINNIELEIK